MTDFKRWALAALLLFSAGAARAQQMDETEPAAAEAAVATHAAAPASGAETPSVREMIGRIKGLWSTTGIAGFLLKDDPADAADPARAASHKKTVLPLVRASSP